MVFVRSAIRAMPLGVPSLQATPNCTTKLLGIAAKIHVCSGRQYGMELQNSEHIETSCAGCRADVERDQRLARMAGGFRE
jgi:hypothetical protein